MPVVIKAENISKLYKLGTLGMGTISEDLTRFVARLRGKIDPTELLGSENILNKVDSKYIWSLKDINFEVKKGEVLGIIGKNGAGKSTLLKLLSKITTPTTGTIKIKGRVVSLLEVGTGFHPELSGTENIYLNGAILGMTRAEIKGKFDEIVDFAGIEKYLNTPVKRYSSGMYLRLAFAIAAHLEPEIMIIDEVLAVGDLEFQKKAVSKMQEVSRNDGRTVLFVSHNMGAINDLCTNCMLLKQGKIVEIGPTKPIVKNYISEALNIDRKDIKASDFHRDIKSYKERLFIERMEMVNGKVLWKEVPEFTFDVRIIDKNITSVEFVFGINGSNGSRIFTYESKETYDVKGKELLSFKIEINEPRLVPSEYYVSLEIRSYLHILDAIDNYLKFEIIDYDKDNNHFGNSLGVDYSGYIDTKVKVKEL